MIRRPPRSTLSSSSAASDVYKRQIPTAAPGSTAESDEHEVHRWLLAGPAGDASDAPGPGLRHLVGDDTMTVYAPTSRIRTRHDTLNRPVVTVTYSSPMPDVIRVRIEHHAGATDAGPSFELHGPERVPVQIEVDGTVGVLTSGGLSVRVYRGDQWRVDFVADGRVLTSSPHKGIGVISSDDGAHYVHEQLTLGVGEQVYGLGERFGAFVKNGQAVDIWNADGGTSSEQAYKNVPFYLTSGGYGVFVNQPERVSFEVGSENVSRTQFSVPGQSLEYFVIHGPTPKDVLRRYTALTGRPAQVPDWSFGLWMSTSFTTDYDEQTVTGFIEQMAERDLPLSVVHFDCFWMRELNWCDFEWDPRTFPDPEGMLARLKERGLRVCVWINPYIAQRSPLFREAAQRGYLVRRPDGSVWQWDRWQAGMGLVDFTNPDAAAWFTGHLDRLLAMGVDAFKTDFGERIPTDVVWHDRSDPQRMHNYYAHLYSKAIFDQEVEDRLAVQVGVVGRRLLVDLRGDGRVAARRTVARTVGLRLLEPRHRRLRGHPRPEPVQAVDRLRPALVAFEAARLGLVPGAVGVRRGGRRHHAALHAPQALAHALPHAHGR